MRIVNFPEARNNLKAMIDDADHPVIACRYRYD